MAGVATGRPAAWKAPLLALALAAAPRGALGAGVSQEPARPNHTEWLLRPCTPLVTTDCLPGRFQPCGTIKGGFNVKIAADDFSGCASGGMQLQPFQNVLIQFTQGKPANGGQCLEIVMRIGECWGQDSDGNTYNCMGECWAGCQINSPGICSNWGANCLRHDVCSFYYNSQGGLLSPNCGYAFFQATKEYVVPCLTDHRCQIPQFNTWQQVCAHDEHPGRGHGLAYESESGNASHNGSGDGDAHARSNSSAPSFGQGDVVPQGEAAGVLLP